MEFEININLKLVKAADNSDVYRASVSCQDNYAFYASKDKNKAIANAILVLFREHLIKSKRYK